MSDLPTFDQFWERLVHRVHHQHERLQGQEALFFRLSCIYGETMVDGIEAYFERRFGEYEADMEALASVGFSDVAAEFGHARRLMFGELPLERSTVDVVLDKFADWEDSGEAHAELVQLDQIYGRVIPRLEQLAVHRFQLGVDAGLYQDEELVFEVAPSPVNKKPAPPCPQCGKPLRAELAKQCFECGADWH